MLVILCKEAVQEGFRANMEFAEPLLRAALAVGVEGIFMEFHDNPEKALSDGTTSVKLSDLESLLKRNTKLWIK